MGTSCHRVTAVRGIRGATTISKDEPEEIIEATTQLLKAIFEANDIETGEIASIIFSVTPDIDSAFPARAAREMGLTDTALFCCQEAGIKGDIARCIRVLVHYNTHKAQSEMKHVYLRGASVLRPDLR